MDTKFFLFFALVRVTIVKADDKCNENGCDPRFLIETCKNDPRLMLPHKGECQLYYNCSRIYVNVPKFFEQHLDECPYPKLFSSDTYTCEDPGIVECGTRTEIKDKCDYRQHQCASSHCYPCHILNPSCESKKDGFHGHPSKPNSPYYITCKNERLVKVDMCERDQTGRQMIVLKNRCI